MIDINEMAVLIIDDMPAMITAIRNAMKVLGYGNRFFDASNGQEAWRVLKKETIDIAIMDYNMPIMSGGELLSQVREDKDMRFLPVVMITAEANLEFVAEAAESEIDAYILKPLTVSVLGDKVEQVIEMANNPPPMIFHLRKAKKMEDEGDLDGAVRETLLASEAEPDSSRPIRDLGYYHLAKKNLEEAEKWLLKAAKMNSMDVVAFHNLGELYLERNEIDEASKYFEMAMNISPRHLSRGINFGKILVEKKKIDRAISVFNKAINVSKKDRKLREEIALFCIDKGVNEYGAKRLEEIVTTDDRRTDLFFTLGSVLEKIGENTKALNYLSGAEAKEEDNMEIKMQVASVLLKMGWPIRAERKLRKVLAAEPKNKKAKKLLRECA